MNLFGSKGGRAMLRAVQGGNKDVMTQILKGVGAKRVSQADFDALASLAGAYDKVPSQGELLSQTRSLLMGTPQEIAVKTGLQTLASGLKAGGDITQNNANRLAQAVLAASRSNSNRQNELFGPSKIEKGAEAWGQNKIRKGEAWSKGLNAAGDTIEKILGTYSAADTMAKGMELAQLQGGEGPVGSYYNMLHGAMQRADKISRR